MRLRTGVILSLLYCVIPIMTFASTSDGTLNPEDSNVAWSENIGWINFHTHQGNVRITDDGMTGYAWSDSYGWINLAPTQSGIRNDGEGHLSGSAWGENIGWINFSGITIDERGVFHGRSSGEIVGTVNFDCTSCSVSTDWRPRRARNTEAPSPAAPQYAGVPATPPESFLPPIRPSQNFSLSVNGVAGTSTVTSRTVQLTLHAGTDVNRMALSSDANFSHSSLELFTPTTAWDLCSSQHGLIKFKQCPPGIYHIYAKFYTAYGRSSDPIFTTVILQTPTSSQILPPPQIIPLPIPQPVFNAPTTTNTVKTPLFTRNLSLGTKHPDVQRLQRFLNANKFFVSMSGFGSPGHETNEFGRKTDQALRRFQHVYTQQIFTKRSAQSNDFGTFGPLTRLYVNSLR